MRSKQITIGDVQEGQWFVFRGRTYLRVARNFLCRLNQAVDVSTGEIVSLPADDPIDRIVQGPDIPVAQPDRTAGAETSRQQTND